MRLNSSAFFSIEIANLIARTPECKPPLRNPSPPQNLYSITLTTDPSQKPALWTLNVAATFVYSGFASKKRWILGIVDAFSITQEEKLVEVAMEVAMGVVFVVGWSRLLVPFIDFEYLQVFY